MSASRPVAALALFCVLLLRPPTALGQEPPDEPVGRDLPIERWIDELISSDPARQVGAARAIAKEGAAAVETVPALVFTLETTWDDDVVREASAALVGMGEAGVPGLIIELLESDGSGAPVVLRILARLGPRARAAVPTLIRRLEADEMAAVRALAAIGGEAAAPLVEVLSDGSAAPLKRALATRALAAMREPPADAFGLVLGQLDDRTRPVVEREAAAHAVSRLGAPSDQVFDVLERRLADEPEELVRSELIGGFLLCGRPGIERLVRMTESDLFAETYPARVALEVLEPKAVASLVEALDSDVSSVRRLALEKLSELGPAAAPAIEKLLAVLVDEGDVGLVEPATRALGGIGPAAADALAGLVASQAIDRHARLRACAALEMMAGDAAAAVDALRGVLVDTAPAALRRAAVDALGAIGPPARAAAAELLEIFRTERGPAADADLRRAAGKALVAVGAEESLPIRELFEADDASLRNYAANVVRGLRAKAPPQPRGRIVVGPISYPGPVSRTRAIELAELREGLIVALRLVGFAVARESAMPPRRIAFEEHPLERLGARAPDATAIVSLAATEPTTVSFQGGVGEKSRTVELSSGELGLPALLAAVLPELTAHPHDEGGEPLGLPRPVGNVHEDWLRGSERLGWGQTDRLIELDRRLERLGLGDHHVQTLLELAVISTLHACYGWLTDEITARRHFGRGRFFAAWARAHPDPEQRAIAKGVGAELEALRRRFGEAIEEPLPREALLPEVATVKRLAETESLEALLAHYSESTELFEALAWQAHAIDLGWPGYPLPGTFVDYLLIASKRASLEPASFGLVEFHPGSGVARRVHSSVGFGECLAEIERLALALGFEELPARIQDAVVEVDSGAGSVWDLLDNVGANARGKEDRLQALQSGAKLWVARAIEAHARESSAFDAGLGVSLPEVFDELVRRYQELVLIRRFAYRQLGWTEPQEGLDEVLSRYGRDRVQVRRPWPGLEPVQPIAAAVKGAVDERTAAVKHAFHERRYDDALELTRPLLDSLGSGDGLLDPATGWFNIYLRAGRVDEGLKVFMQKKPESFDKDHFRDEVLAHVEDDPGKHTDYFDDNTHSAKDYITRARFGLRTRNWPFLLDATNAYHYTPRARIILALEAVGEIVTEGDSTTRWETLESALAKLQRSQDRDTYDAVRHWDPILDEELGEREEWSGVKESLRWSDWVAVSRARHTLRGAPTHAEVAGAVDALAGVAADRLGGEGLDEDGLFQTSVELQHFGVALFIAGATDDLADPETIPLVVIEKVTRLLEQTRAYSAAFESLNTPWRHIPSWFLHYLVQLAVPAERVARFAAAFPGLAERLASEHRDAVFALAAGSPPIMERILASAREPVDFEVLRLYPPEIDEATLFAFAFESGDDRCALEVALGNALRARSLRFVRFYLDDDEAGRAWVWENAPSRAVARSWLEELTSLPAEVTAARAARTEVAALPSVPSLLDYLAGR